MVVAIVSLSGKTEVFVSRWRGDKRANKRRLSLRDIIADSYLIAVEKTVRTVICELPKGPKDLPLPRLIGWTQDEKVLALVPGAFLFRLMQKKGGFSETEQYLESLYKGLKGDAKSVRVLIWDLEDDFPADRLQSMSKRVSASLSRVTRDDLSRVLPQIKGFALLSKDLQENWFLDSWRWIQGGEQWLADNEELSNESGG
jgi:hypothetical protein